ncbi:MAG: LapA family protein [Bdellovibrionota bacterium]
MKIIRNLSIFLMALIVVSVLGLFSIQNFESVKLQFMSWATPSVPLAAAVITSFVMGFLVASILFFFHGLKIKSAHRKVKKKLNVVEKELESLRNLPIDEEPMDRPIQEAQIVEDEHDDYEQLRNTPTY